MKRIRNATAPVAALLILLTALSLMSCQEPASNEPVAKSITVRVDDGTGAKTIKPDGNVDVNKYKITVVNKAENNLTHESGYLAKGANFVVRNVPAGMWTATVEAFVTNDAKAEPIKVAEATSEATRVEAGVDATITVTLDELQALASGDITITLDMPAELDDEKTEYWYTYTIAGAGGRDGYNYTLTSPTKGIVGPEGNGQIVIDADALQPALNQGAYLITVTVFDEESEEDSAVVRKGVDMMRLLPGLPAKGMIDLSYQVINDDGFTISVVDKVGDLIELSQTSTTFGDDRKIVITGNAVTNSIPVDVYIDGIKTDSGSVFTVSGGEYTFAGLGAGAHIISFVALDSDTEMGVGSLSVRVNVPNEITITPATGTD